MATASKNFSRFTPTENELSKLSDALKSEEFRRLVCQYAKDLNHPENRARYEAEIVQFEAERGVECTFLHPDPGYVIKTTNLRNDEKVFVNVCSDPSVDKPQSKKAVSSGIGSAGAGGVEWSIPYSQSGQARRENDRQGRPCSVYDVIFHPDALALANRSGRLKHLVTETALEAVEKAAPTLVKLEHHNLKFPKMKFKGAFQPTVIRKPLPKEKTKKRPEHSLKFRHHVTDLPKAAAAVGRGVEDPCRPSELVVEIHLPELDSAQGVELDILERQLTLESSTPLAAAEYSLTVPFPYPVEEDKGSAKFEKSTKKLIVVAPVKADPHETIHRLVSTDSGIEMDPAFALEDEEVEDDEHDQERRKSSPASQTPSSGGEQEKREDLLFPSYSCNIYEGLMIFTLDVKHVSESSLIKTSMIEEDFGFSLKFSSVGKGMVPFHYGFYCALVIPEEDRCRLIKDPLESIEVEVWDNNVIVKVSLPKAQRAPCHQYKVGSNPDDLTLHSLPQLRAFRKRKEEKLGNSSPPSSGANSPAKSFSPTHQAARSSERSSIVEDELEDDAFSPEDDALKERHHSGDSEDSALAISPPSAAAASSEVEPSSPSRFLVTPTKLDENNEPREPDFLPEIPQFSSYGLGQEFKGILKRRGQRCFSESQADGMTLSSWTGSDISSVTSDLDASLGSSKKSVRFNNTVQRQIFRPDSSILGQKRKNQKKSEQKKRKAERRASEGDVEEMMKMHETVPEEEEEEDEETDVHEDSGVEDVGGDKRDRGMLPGKSEGADTLKDKKKSKKSSGKKNSNNNIAAAGKKPMDAAPVPGQNGKHGFLSERTTDLIFDLDF